jgi:hypothetical protein
MVSDVRKINMHIVDSLVTDHKHFEPEIAITKLKKYQSAISDQNLVDIIQAGGEILRSGIHELMNSVCNEDELPHQWNES